MNLKEAAALSIEQLKKADKDMLDYLQRELNQPKPVLNLEPIADMVEISDGYHTMNELYKHRIILYITLCKLWDIKDLPEKNVWRSKLHHDGTKYEGWFILGINKQPGNQITYHIPLSYWKDTGFAQTLNNAPEWDGHTSPDVLERLQRL